MVTINVVPRTRDCFCQGTRDSGNDLVVFFKCQHSIWISQRLLRNVHLNTLQDLTIFSISRRLGVILNII